MNSDKLKSIIYKRAHGNSDISQKFYQLFYFERILERISISNYRGQIILKGGLLLTSIIGDDERTTKDMDATLKGIPLTKNDVEKVFNEILHIDIDDGVSFQIISIKDIRLEDEYGGFRLNILSTLDNNKTYITVELTTGDVITPKEMKYNYNSIFEDKKIPIMSYTLETVLAEKFQTIVTRGLLNTRLKDFYDVYILINTKIDDLNRSNLIKAIKNTFKRRETNFDLEQFNEVINDLSNDNNMNNLWNEYVSKNPYAKGVKFEDTIKAIKEIVEILESELVGV
mgnify:FL=1